MAFTSNEAKELNKQIFETIYYAAMEALVRNHFQKITKTKKDVSFFSGTTMVY